MSEILDVVDERDVVIGQAERDEVHRLGLLCRLSYVCFYTDNGEIILQKRSATKKNDPGRLTTSVSGHVANGQTYLEAAVRETFEETGIDVRPDQLMDMGIVRADYIQGDYLSYAMRGMFAYKFDGIISDLQIEDGDGAGFMSFPIEELEKRLDTEPERFATILTDKAGRDLLGKIHDHLRGASLGIERL